MRTLTLARSRAIGVRWAVRMAVKSRRVAEWTWNAAFVIMLVAGMNGSVLPLLASIALLAAATQHRNNIEHIKN